MTEVKLVGFMEPLVVPRWLVLFRCNPEQSYEQQLIDDCERACKQREIELDQAMERELFPEVEIAEPEVIPAELLIDWDAYSGGDNE